MLIKSNQPHGFYILDQKNQQIKEFKSIHEVITFYNNFLKIPYSSSLPKEKYFILLLLFK